MSGFQRSLRAVGHWRTATRVALGALLACVASSAQASSYPEAKGDIASGEEIFMHRWTPGDSRSRGGDGLGPVFNARSCAACHHQGGAGGAGGQDANVQVLRVNRADAPFSNFKPPLIDHSEAGEVHPLLKSERSTVLHKYSTGDGYETWRKERVAKSGPSTLQMYYGSVPVEALTSQIDVAALKSDFDGVAASIQFAFFQRTETATTRRLTSVEEISASPLFGSGLIDDIPDRAIEDASKARLKFAAAVGRVSRLPDGRIGRFGWRANRATLHEFTLDACANELGLETPDRMQPLDPRADKSANPGYDLSKQDCDDLTAYLKSLPRPTQIDSTGPGVREGRKWFSKVGCADCHRADLGPVQGIYSDLLLHDMSPLSSSGTYGRIIRAQVAKADRARHRGKKFASGVSPTEWRTPPLWGCRDSGPYMHDGRANTLDQAILAHTGQALASLGVYKSLSREKQQQIVAFLNSLAAPKDVLQVPALELAAARNPQ